MGGAAAFKYLHEGRAMGIHSGAKGEGGNMPGRRPPRGLLGLPAEPDLGKDSAAAAGAGAALRATLPKQE